MSDSRRAGSHLCRLAQRQQGLLATIQLAQNETMKMPNTGVAPEHPKRALEALKQPFALPRFEGSQQFVKAEAVAVIRGCLLRHQASLPSGAQKRNRSASREK